MEFLALAVLLGLLPAVVAQKKGKSFVLWWIYGSLLFIVAMPHALIMGESQSRFRRCPHCAESVRVEANVCPHCQRDIVVRSPAPAT